MHHYYSSHCWYCSLCG